MQTPVQRTKTPSHPSSNIARGTTATPVQQTPPVDYHQLLLLLAEDYINAAHGMGSLVAFYRRSEDLKQYYTLVATGLSCMEAALTQYSLPPQPHARLVLQYCNMVFKETENHDEVDKWLSKTVR